MPLRTLGNWYFRGPAFGDPQEAFRQLAPRGLLDAYDEEQQIARGQDVQRQLRSWTPRSQVIEPFRQGLLDEQEAIRQQQQTEALQAAIPGLIDAGYISPARAAVLQADPSLLPKVMEQLGAFNTAAPGHTAFTGPTPIHQVPTTEFQTLQSQIGQMRGDPNYLEDLAQLTRAGQGTMTLGAGQGAFDPLTFETLAAQPPTAVQERDAGVRGEAERDIDRRIRDIMSDPGHFGGYSRAARLARGQERIEIVPTLGIARRIDDIAGTVDEVPIGSLSAYEREVGRVIPDGEPSSPQDLSATATDAATGASGGLYQAAELGTGPAAMARRFGSQYIAPLDPTGTLPIAGQTLAAQQKLQISNRDLQRAFANNPRYPVAEMERIREATNVEGMFFDTPRALQIRLGEIEDYLSGVLQNERRIVRDPNAGADRRRAAETAISDIEQYLGTFGPRPEWMRGQQTSQEEVQIPNWVLPDDVGIWPHMTPEERREYESLIQAMRGNR